MKNQLTKIKYKTFYCNMSKTKYWDEQTQQWVITGASNALNIELSNPGYLDENGESISVD